MFCQQSCQKAAKGAASESKSPFGMSLRILWGIQNNDFGVPWWQHDAGFANRAAGSKGRRKRKHTLVVDAHSESQGHPKTNFALLSGSGMRHVLRASRQHDASCFASRAAMSKGGRKRKQKLDLDAPRSPEGIQNKCFAVLHCSHLTRRVFQQSCKKRSRSKPHQNVASNVP